MKHQIIGTAGHVDHGKTALIKLLTGKDCDTHRQEKERGITINLGFSYLDLPGGESAGIIDVPGHKDFIPTMVGGAAGIDMVLLVIAADSGIMPQTIEHVNIITSLGITRGVIALTKTDLVDHELLEIAREEISDFLAKTSLKDCPIINVSSVTGSGKQELTEAIVQVLSESGERQKSNLFRMYIDRIFSIKGSGSVVTGSILGGHLKVGDDVFLLPGNDQRLRVRSIERHGKPTAEVMTGDRAAVNLAGFKREDFDKGMILCDRFIEASRMIDCRISIFDMEIKIPIWSTITFISGSFECMAEMHLLNRDQVGKNTDALVQIHLSKPAVLFTKDRFIIRNSSADITLGGGFIIDVTPLHHRRRPPWLIERLSVLSEEIFGDNGILEEIRHLLLKEFRPFTLKDTLDKLHLSYELLPALQDQNSLPFQYYRTAGSDILIARECEDLYSQKLVKILGEHRMKEDITGTGLTPGELMGKTGLSRFRCGKEYLELLLDKMNGMNLIERSGETWILKGATQGPDEQSLAAIEWLEKEILKYGYSKPVWSEIEEKALLNKIPKSRLRSYLNYLASKGKIRFFHSEFIHTAILEECRKTLLGFLSGKENGADIQEFKELIPGTKKFRAELLDIFESEKIIKVNHDHEEKTRIIITPKGTDLMSK